MVTRVRAALPLQNLQQTVKACVIFLIVMGQLYDNVPEVYLTFIPCFKDRTNYW